MFWNFGNCESPLCIPDSAQTTRLNRGSDCTKSMKVIDLRSDTVTQPTDEMIESIVQAHKAGRFGDDVIGEDEVIHELQEKTAYEPDGSL